MTSLRRQLLLWQVIAGLGMLGLALWAVLLPRTTSDHAAVVQLTRAVSISFAVMMAGLVASVLILVRHRELRNWSSTLVTVGIGAVAGVLGLMIWYFILPGRLG